MFIVCPSCDVKFQIPDGALGALGRRVQCSSCKHEWFEFANQNADEAKITQGDAVRPPQAPADHTAPPAEAVVPVAAATEGVVAHQESKASSELPDFKDVVAPVGEGAVAAALAPDQFASAATGDGVAAQNIVSWHIDHHDGAGTSTGMWILLLKATWIMSIFAILCIWLVSNRHFFITQSHWWQEIYEGVGFYDHSSLKFEGMEAQIKPGSKNGKSAVEIKITLRNVSHDQVFLDSMKFGFLDKDKNKLGEYTMALHRAVAADGSDTIEGDLDDLDPKVTFMIVSLGSSAELKLLSDKVLSHTDS